jgi:hypothetical protein
LLRSRIDLSGDEVRVAATQTKLSGIGEVREFFSTCEQPVYFVSATAFNLLGIDRWVRSFRYVNYYDSFDGAHPGVFVPRDRSPRAFESIEEICNYLLGHKEVIDHVLAQAAMAGGRAPGHGPSGLAVFLMFDDETEQLARELGLEVAFPPASLRHRLDSKLETTRLANEAGVPSVPNVLGRAATYGELLGLARARGLGSDLVVQTPYGDSGKTTFFIAAEDDWRSSADDLAREDLKVMRRIDPRETAIEGVVTRAGTIVGPLMTELTGFPQLTPYGGGWCGNDIHPGLLTPERRALVRTWTHALGERLRAEGYRGYFELDFLVDAVSGEIYLGEMNPRVTGASPMTQVNAAACGGLPLFLFHLLEYMDVEFELDVDELNACAADEANLEAWSQFILKDVDERTELITDAPPTGVWRMLRDGTVEFDRPASDWWDLAGESEAFYLRIAGPGGWRYPGADLGVVVGRGRFQSDDYELADRAKLWIAGLKSQFRSIRADAEPLVPRQDSSFKLF